MYPTPALRYLRSGLFFYDLCLRPILLRIPYLGCPTFIRDVPRRVVQAEGEPLLRRGTLPGQTLDNRKECLVVYWTLASRHLIFPSALGLFTLLAGQTNHRQDKTTPEVRRRRCRTVPYRGASPDRKSTRLNSS